MHYKNGREVKNGDKVVLLPSYGNPVVGILYDAIAGNNTCNGKIAPIALSDPMPNLQECLHLDDVKGLLPRSADGKTLDLSKVEDTSKASEVNPVEAVHDTPQAA